MSRPDLLNLTKKARSTIHETGQPAKEGSLSPSPGESQVKPVSCKECGSRLLAVHHKIDIKTGNKVVTYWCLQAICDSFCTDVEFSTPLI